MPLRRFRGVAITSSRDANFGGTNKPSNPLSRRSEGDADHYIKGSRPRVFEPLQCAQADPGPFGQTFLTQVRRQTRRAGPHGRYRQAKRIQEITCYPSDATCLITG